MKKLSFLLFSITLTFAFAASAQEAQPPSTGSSAESSVVSPSPKAFVQAGLGLNMCQGDCDNVDSSYGINLSGFYNVAPNIYAGASFYYADFGFDSGSLYTMTFAAEGRYQMILPSNPKVTVYGLGGLGFTKGKYEFDSAYGSSSSSDSAYTIILGGGANYNLSPLMSVGLMLKYQYNMWDDWANNNSEFNNIFIGATFSYVLPL